MIAVTLFVVLLLLGVAATRWGADSRDGRDWQPLHVETKPTGPTGPTGLAPAPVDGGTRLDRAA